MKPKQRTPDQIRAQIAQLDAAEHQAGQAKNDFVQRLSQAMINGTKSEVDGLDAARISMESEARAIARQALQKELLDALTAEKLAEFEQVCANQCELQQAAAAATERLRLAEIELRAAQADDLTKQNAFAAARYEPDGFILRTAQEVSRVSGLDVTSFDWRKFTDLAASHGMVWCQCSRWQPGDVLTPAMFGGLKK